MKKRKFLKKPKTPKKIYKNYILNKHYTRIDNPIFYQNKLWPQKQTNYFMDFFKDSHMKSFHSDTAIKEKYLSRVKWHREQDRLVRGIGYVDGKGCAVGCTLENYDHSQYPIELGLPEWLAHLEDRIFEGLSTEDAMLWPERFLEAIPVGVDVEDVRHKLAIRRMDRLIELQEKNDINNEDLKNQVIAAIKMVKSCHEAELNRDTCDWESAERSAERSAANAAANAAASAVWSAESAAKSRKMGAWIAAWNAESGARSAMRSAESAAESSAENSERSAAWSAESAANSAASAARSAWRSALSAVWKQEADDVIELLRECEQ
jgi:hypothetical protein